MDGNRFDTLAKGLAQARSRRGVFKSLGAAALGAAGFTVFGGGAGASPSCRSAGHPCEGHQTCCDGLVCVVSGPGAAKRCTPCPAGQIACGGVCIPACAASDQCHVAGVCDPAAQACTNPAAADGTHCDDGNACTQTDACQAGVCTGGDPIDCQPLDQCHVAGTCNPADGSCSNPNAADGLTCDDGNACTTGDACTAGVCGGTPVTCSAPTVCQVSVACDSGSGKCLAVNQPDGTECGAVSPCAHDICQAGVCVTNVPKPKGTACNDQNSCTQTDACDGAGTCVGGDPVVCHAPDACFAAGTCNAATGACDTGPILDGWCFIGGICRHAGEPDPDNSCGVCDPSRSTISFSSVPDLTTCDDGNPCTTGDFCLNGFCDGAPVACGSPDQCHQDGVCDPATGTCTYADATDGTTCDDGNPCTTGDACVAGVCKSGGSCDTPAVCGDDGCCTPDFHLPTGAAPCCSGTYDSTTGLCDHVPLGFSCSEDRNCGAALDPACCNGVCRDLATDPLNCGTCGSAITLGAACENGQSVCQLPEGDFCPNPDRCVDLQVDLNNCGACGVPAPVGGVCLGGVPQCTPGFHNDNGVCCASGWANCGGACVDLTVDLNNCGACGVPAPSGGVCSFGVPTCTPGFDDCSGTCVSLSADPYNCGACGHDCGKDCFGNQVLCAFSSCDLHC